MKLLFWTAVIVGVIWYFLKSRLGANNDLTAHLAEQKALQSIGDSALGSNQISSGNWPLASIGNTPLAGLHVDPFNRDSIFTTPQPVQFNQATPSWLDSNPFAMFGIN